METRSKTRFGLSSVGDGTGIDEPISLSELRDQVTGTQAQMQT